MSYWEYHSWLLSYENEMTKWVVIKRIIKDLGEHRIPFENFNNKSKAARSKFVDVSERIVRSLRLDLRS